MPGTIQKGKRKCGYENRESRLAITVWMLDTQYRREKGKAAIGRESTTATTGGMPETIQRAEAKEGGEESVAE